MQLLHRIQAFQLFRENFLNVIISQVNLECPDCTSIVCDVHRISTTDEANVDVYSQIRAHLRRFRPCSQVEIALEGWKFAHKASVAGSCIWGLRDHET